MIRISCRMFAGDGERFAPGCFDASVGSDVQVQFTGVLSVGRLIEAATADDGKSVRFTIEAETD